MKKIFIGFLGWIVNLMLFRRDFMIKSARVDHFFPLGLIIVDMQDHFLNQLSRRQRKKLIATIIRTIDFFIERNWPIFVVEFYNRGKTILPLRKTLGFYSKVSFVKKTGNNSFNNTSLKRLCKEVDVGGVVLAGLNASACVQETARAAKEIGLAILSAREILADDENNFDISWYIENAELYCFQNKKLLTIIQGR